MMKQDRFFALLLVAALLSGSFCAPVPAAAAYGKTFSANDFTTVVTAAAAAPEAEAAELPAAEMPETEAPAAETPGTEAPPAEMPETEAPPAETPETEAPPAEPATPIVEEDYLWPVPSGTLTSRGYDANHTGLDINGAFGNVVATKTGTVIRIYSGCHNVAGASAGGHSCSPETCEYHYPSFHPAYARYFCNYGYGNFVILQHTDGSGYSIYMHMASFNVKEGDTVPQGGVLGVMGSTGAATGTHVHFELCEDITFIGDYPKIVGSIDTSPDKMRYVYSAATLPQIHTHELVHVEAVEPSEEHNGNIEYWYCEGCDKYFADAEGVLEISSGEIYTAPLTHTHTLLHIGAVTPTEDQDGNLEYWYCSGCGSYFLDDAATRQTDKAETVLPKTGVDKPPEEETPAEPGMVHFRRPYTYAPNWFADVNDSDWFYHSVESAFELDLMKGVGVGDDGRNRFNPSGNVTVAEAVTMAARINCIYLLGRENFNQEEGSNWYQVYLDYALEHGIIGRAIYNHTDVTQPISRSKFAEILAKALPEDGLRSVNQISDGIIPDVPVSADYAGSVYLLYRAGIMMGNDDGNFKPDAQLTRAEAATVISRMAESSSRIHRDLTYAPSTDTPVETERPAAVG